jgi:hypothetical protein
MNDLSPTKASKTAVSLSGNLVIPAAIAGAGDKAVRRFLEFFAATIRNRNTREAYYRAACSFFAWLDQNGIGALDDIEPLHVSLYIETLQTTAAKPTVKQHLAAIRVLFDSSSGRSCRPTRRTRCAGPSISCVAARHPS